MKGFINLLTLVVTVIAETITKSAPSLVYLSVNKPIRRTGVGDRLNEKNDIAELDKKLLQIITEMTYPENAEAAKNLQYKLIAEGDSGVEMYSIKDGSDSVTHSKAFGHKKHLNNVRSSNDSNGVKTIRIVHDIENDSHHGSSSSVRTVRILQDESHSTPSETNESPSYSYHPGSYKEGAYSSNSIAHVRPVKPKTIKVEGGIVLKLLDDHGVDGTSFSDSSSYSPNERNVEVIRLIHEHGNHYGGSIRSPNVRKFRTVPMRHPHPPSGRQRNTNKINTPPPRPLRQPYPPHSARRQLNAGHVSRSRTTRVIHERSIGHGDRNMNPDIQAFQVINDAHNNGQNNGRIYRIRVLESH